MKDHRIQDESDTLNKNNISVFIAEDDPDDFYLVQQMLLQDPKHAHYDITHCSSLEHCLSALEIQLPDVLLLDLGLGDSQGIETLHAITQSSISFPIIVFTGVMDEELGKAAVKSGAADYLPKAEASATLLSRSITYAIERHHLVQALKEEALKDYLTQLPNRSAFYDRLEIQIDGCERNSNTLAVAMLDLDGFKEINDTLGHKAGDDLLRHIASRLNKGLRRSDMAARFGGDEFVLMITNHNDTNELLQVLERKQNQLIQPITLYVDGSVHTVSVGVSIGVVEWSPGLTPLKIIDKADEAMYTSKRNGKKRITL